MKAASKTRTMSSSAGTQTLVEATLAILISLFPHNACRPHQQQQYKNGIICRQGQSRLEIGHDTAYQAQDKASHKTAGDAAQAAQDDHDDSDDGILETHQPMNGVAHADQHAGETSHGSTQAEAQCKHPVDIYPHEPRGGRVLGCRPDGLAYSSPGQIDIERQADDDSKAECNQAVGTKQRPPEIDRDNQIGVAPDLGAPDDQGYVLDDEQEAKSSQHRIALKNRR